MLGRGIVGAAHIACVPRVAAAIELRRPFDHENPTSRHAVPRSPLRVLRCRPRPPRHPHHRAAASYRSLPDHARPIPSAYSSIWLYTSEPVQAPMAARDPIGHVLTGRPPCCSMYVAFLASDKASWIAGQIVQVYGGLIRTGMEGEHDRAWDSCLVVGLLARQGGTVRALVPIRAPGGTGRRSGLQARTALRGDRGDAGLPYLLRDRCARGAGVGRLPAVPRQPDTAYPRDYVRNHAFDEPDDLSAGMVDRRSARCPCADREPCPGRCRCGTEGGRGAGLVARCRPGRTLGFG